MDPRSEQQPGRSPLIAGALLVLIVFCVYAAGLWGGFVWDDASLLASSFLSPQASHPWKLIWTSASAAHGEEHYWPVVYSAFLVQSYLWGGMTSAAGFKLVNLLLHCANTVLVWRIFVLMRIRAPWIAALVFGLHPTHVESVTWVIELKDCLAGFFFLVAWLLFFAWRTANTYKSSVYYLLTLTCLVLGVWSKTIVAVLPLCLVIGIWFMDGRISRRDAKALVPLIIVSAILGALDTLISARATQATVSYWMLERIGIAATVFWFYLAKLLVPHPLVPIYPKWQIWWGIPASAALMALVIWLFVGRHKTGRAPLTATLLFVLLLAPVSGIIPFSYMQHAFVADRYLYLSSIPAIAFIVAVCSRMWQRHPDLAALLAAIIIILLGTRTILQTLVWRSNRSLFEHVIRYNPEAAVAYPVLAGVAFNDGDKALALTYAERALKLHPADVVNHRNLALLLLRNGQNEEAAFVASEALKRWPGDKRLVGIREAAAADEGVTSETIRVK